jgi:hypothetical protein
VKKWHLIAGVMVWLLIALFAFKWVVNPFVWAHWSRAVEEATLAHAQRAFPIHFAKFRTENPAISRASLADVGDEEFGDADLINDWAFREMRNRFVFAFVLWMASGFFLRWFIGRIVRGQRDYT